MKTSSGDILVQNTLILINHFNYCSGEIQEVIGQVHRLLCCLKDGVH